MSDPLLGNPQAGDEPLNPLALASVILGVVGVIVYCCGSFICMGWVGFFFGLIGAVCGGVALAQGTQGTNKILSVVGLILNLGFGVLMLGLMFIGVGASVLSSMLQGSSY